jgi:hypothetical protein
MTAPVPGADEVGHKSDQESRRQQEQGDYRTDRGSQPGIMIGSWKNYSISINGWDNLADSDVARLTQLDVSAHELPVIEPEVAHCRAAGSAGASEGGHQEGPVESVTLGGRDLAAKLIS